MNPGSLSRFVLKVVLWLPLCFAVWYFCAPALLVPVQWLLQGVVALAFPDLIRDVERQGHLFSMITTLRPQLAIGAAMSGTVVLEVNALLYTFGLPFLCALSLASGERQALLRNLLLGYLALLPFALWGITADALKQIAITSGPAIAAQAGFSAESRELIVFMYQFGALILPAVAPVVIWVLLHRRFLAQLGFLSIQRTSAP